MGRPEELRREGLFAVEGRLVLPRLLASRYRVHSVLLSEAATSSLQPVLDAHPGVRTLVAPVETIAEVSGYNFHRGCLALGYRAEPPPLASLLAPERGLEPLLVLEGVNNPDNVGGIFRSAHAFGARGIVLGPGCADPLYRKAIRTSMGATLDVPRTHAASLESALNALRARGILIVALTTEASARPLRDAVTGAGAAPVAFLLGSEGFGLSEAALSLADIRARIPMRNASADSLNVAAAASIALYEGG